MASLAQFGVLTVIAGIFVYALHRKWENVYLAFGILFFLGSCKMLGAE